MDPLGIEHVIDEVNARTIPLINSALADAIDRLNKELSANIDRAAVEFSNVINGTLLGVQGIVNSVPPKVAELLAAQDGWTATITIPPITIRLTKPKGEPCAT